MVKEWNKVYHGRACYSSEINDHLTRIYQKHPWTTTNLPSRKILPILGTLAPDIVQLDKTEQSKEEELDEMARNKRDKQEEEGFGETVAEMQQHSAPLVNAELVEKRLEILFTCNKPDGTEQLVWCKGEVIGVQRNNNVHIGIKSMYMRKMHL